MWKRWHSELPTLINLIPWCYFPAGIVLKSLQLLGYSDVSEVAYVGVVHLKNTGCNDSVITSLIIAKTKVALIKCITVPFLEPCGSALVARLLHHVAKVLETRGENIYAWTNSIVVLSWPRGNP